MSPTLFGALLEHRSHPYWAFVGGISPPNQVSAARYEGMSFEGGDHFEQVGTSSANKSRSAAGADAFKLTF